MAKAIENDLGDLGHGFGEAFGRDTGAVVHAVSFPPVHDEGAVIQSLRQRLGQTGAPSIVLHTPPGRLADLFIRSTGASRELRHRRSIGTQVF